MERCNENAGNAVIVREKANISVPVTVKPIINADEAVAYCCGGPVLLKDNYDSCCRYSECRFVISQNICIEIPIEFSVETEIDGAYINCCTHDNENEEENK